MAKPTFQDDKFDQWRQEIGFHKKSTINPEILEEIAVDIAEHGLPLMVALRAAGVNKGTFDNWCAQYPAVKDMFDQARAQWQKGIFEQIQTAHKGGIYGKGKPWGNLAWSLERTDPDNWAQKGPDQGDAPRIVVQIGSAENVDIKTLVTDARTAAGITDGASSPSNSLVGQPDSLPLAVSVGPKPGASESD